MKLSDTVLQLETIYEDDFSWDRGDWVFEGTKKVQFKDGRLYVDGSGKGTDQYATFWCKQYFEGDCVIEYIWRSQKDPPQGRNNLNFFVYASLLDGASVLTTSDRRTGDYGEYHKFNNYIYTYLSGNKRDVEDRTRVRFRKDPGFHLLKQTYQSGLVEKGRDYHFAIVIQGPRMRYYVDGALVLDYYDTDAPHRRGHHGFRTWHSHVSCKLFRVSKIR